MMPYRYRWPGRPAAVLLAILLALSVPVAEAADGEGGPPILRGESDQFVLLRPPVPAPTVPFLDRYGDARRLDRFRGKVVLLNIWATWCLPCIREMPSLDRLAVAYADRPFVVVPVSIDRGALFAVKRFYRRFGLRNLPIYLDPARRFDDALFRPGLPMSYVIDREGRMQGYLLGAADWDSAEARALIDYYLARVPE